MKIRLRAQKHSVITGVMIAIFVIALGRVAIHFISTSENYNVEKIETLETVMWLVEAIVAGLLIRFVTKKPKETEDGDRPPDRG